MDESREWDPISNRQNIYSADIIQVNKYEEFQYPSISVEGSHVSFSTESQDLKVCVSINDESILIYADFRKMIEDFISLGRYFIGAPVEEEYRTDLRKLISELKLATDRLQSELDRPYEEWEAIPDGE